MADAEWCRPLVQCSVPVLCHSLLLSGAIRGRILGFSFDLCNPIKYCASKGLQRSNESHINKTGTVSHSDKGTDSLADGLYVCYGHGRDF